VPPQCNKIEFRFCVLSYVAPEKVRLRYKLDGVDSDWTEIVNQRSAVYSGLRPGKYELHLKASNNDGVWNDAGAAVALRVLPHFWETWWFIASSGAALIAAVASLARYASHRGLRRELERLERQRDIEQDRARIARDIHDHIGSGLTRINLLNELLLGDPAGQLPNRVGQITGVTCELMRAMDEIVWAVNLSLRFYRRISSRRKNPSSHQRAGVAACVAPDIGGAPQSFSRSEGNFEQHRQAFPCHGSFLQPEIECTVGDA
jgi:hypothetical protein